MRRLLSHYRAVPRPVLRFIAAEQLLTLTNVVLLLIFNLYLRGLGHDDAFIARITSYRFFGTLVLALPAGVYLRGRRLRPLLIGSAVIIPSATWLMLAAAEAGYDGLLAASVLVWGFGMTLLSVSNLPFILRETPTEARTEAISLSFGTFSLSMVLCGLLVPGLRRLESITLGPWHYDLDEAGIIRAIALLGALAVPILWRLDEQPPPGDEGPLLERRLSDYDWSLIGRAIAPTLAIAVGAGLTIPFVNLFFNSVFELEAQQFSMLGGITGVLVLLGSLLNPEVKRRFGYRVAILLTQSLAVCFLICLSLTELLQAWPGMLWIAAACYVLRQPLMNMAGPITSELTMSYVGERNRELMAALHASVWSGSWFLSARLFRLLRSHLLPYWQIFLLTAALYGVGIALFAALIRAHERQTTPPAAAEDSR